MTDADEPDDAEESPADREEPSDREPWPVLESETEYETGWYDAGYDLVEQPDGTENRYYWAELPPAVVVVARIEGTTAVSVEEGAADTSDASGDRLLFVEQYRPAIREHHLELPAGIVEDSDGPEEPRANGDSAGPDGPANRSSGLRGGETASNETALPSRGPREEAVSAESYTEAAARELEEETGFVPRSTTLLQEYAVATGVLRHDRGVVYADDLEPGERALDGNEFLDVTTVPVERALERARERPANDATLSALLLAKEDGLL